MAERIPDSRCIIYEGLGHGAFDRQHPHDLFDIKGLFENEGMTENLKESFIVYLISHNRGFHEILFCRNDDSAHRDERFN